MEQKESLEEFRKKAQHEKDELLTILTLDPISIRLAYFIKKKNLKISPNDITKMRLFFLSPLAIILLLLAPILQIKWFYLIVAFLAYAINLSDDLDGNLARGTGQTSKLGAFLDTIADRFLIIITITTIFSIGIWLQNEILIFGAILIFVLKTFHMMIITKIFYYSDEQRKDKNIVFDGTDATKKLGIKSFIEILEKINSVLKIKRWNIGIGGYERTFITIILPLVLIFAGQYTIAITIEIILIVFFTLFFIIRTRNLLRRTFKEMEGL